MTYKSSLDSAEVFRRSRGSARRGRGAGGAAGEAGSGRQRRRSRSGDVNLAAQRSSKPDSFPLDANLRAVLFQLKFCHLTIDQNVNELLDFFESPDLLGSFAAAGWFLPGHLLHSP